MSAGYLYRVAPATPDQICALVAAHVGFPCGHVGGTILWDVGTHPELRSFAQANAATELNLTGDLGNIFSERAEVRWKRRDDGSYDVLLLTEQGAEVPEGVPLANPWNTRALAIQVRLRRDAQGNAREPMAIRAVEYCAANGAVHFIRYGEVRDELWNT